MAYNDATHFSAPQEAAARQTARQLFAEKGLPGKSDESWRYARIAHTVNIAKAPPSTRAPHCNACQDNNDDMCATLFISEEPGALFPLTQSNAFYLIADAAVRCIYVPKNAKATLDLAEDGASRTYIFVDANADLTVTQRINGKSATVTSLTHLYISANANCRHYILQSSAPDTAILQRADVVLQNDASYDCFRVHAGGKTDKCDAEIRLNGKNARADQHIIAVADADNYRDVYLPVHHNAEHAECSQTVRQASDDSATCVYYGAVYVPKAGAGAKASQLNRNILLGKKAKAYGRPELHILTDDVMCSHGSTTGSPDPLALYYLESRGIPHEEAVAMLLEGFFTPDADVVPDDAIREEATKILHEWAKGRRHDV